MGLCSHNRLCWSAVWYVAFMWQGQTASLLVPLLGSLRYIPCNIHLCTLQNHADLVKCMTTHTTTMEEDFHTDSEINIRCTGACTNHLATHVYTCLSTIMHKINVNCHYSDLKRISVNNCSETRRQPPLPPTQFVRSKSRRGSSPKSKKCKT